MKILGLIAVVIGVSGTVGYMVLRKPAFVATPQADALSHSPRPTLVISDPTDVFQRAFWKRPTAEDQILHAERREWSDSQGLKRWQWFIKVDASPALIKYLREDNSFGLVSNTAAPVIENPPPWFVYQPSEVEILESGQGVMRLIFSKSGNTLYGTDSGAGFQPGAPAAPPPTSKPQASTGRLPNSPPPRPNP